ncbi:MAG: response regulator transcription factor [Bacteroidota bacterium]
MYRILLVEEDVSLGYVLKEYLELHHFHIELAKDGEAALQAFNRSHFDVCILDVMLPKKDGFAVAFEIKQVNEKMPIIFLTAKSLKIDKLKGFNLGADDYMVKPVDEEELIARIQAVMRRVSPETNDKANHQFIIGKYVFDFNNQVLMIGDKKQFITVKEAAVLKLLCEHKGKILDRKQALKRLWGESDYFTRRSMDVFISHLRKYLSDDPAIEIKNVHGKGYILQS